MSSDSTIKKKKVLIIDDSALVRELLSKEINAFKNFTVIGQASDPIYGAEKVMELNPDVITLDIEMPKMDGLTFLEKLMRIRPKPVLIISSLAKENSELALKALELGAIDYVCKPSQKLSESLPSLRREIERKLEACASSRIQSSAKSKKEIEVKYQKSTKNTNDNNIKNIKDVENDPSLLPSLMNFKTTDKIVAIGASTGGTVALAKLLSNLPAHFPGIVVVQHMPPGFTKSFAERLNNECKLSVKEAENNDTIVPGQVLIAPGDKHLVVDRSGTRYFVKLTDHPPIKHHRPSVDVLFMSMARVAGTNGIGVILTGMGDDGADGMVEMKEAGSFTIAQDEKSSTVFGMPKVAIEKGAVHEVISLLEIPPFLEKIVKKL